MVRWEITRKAWSLARDKFPKAKNLYVDVPSKIGTQGSCLVYDLDGEDEPLGRLEYRLSHRGARGGPKLDMEVVVASCAGPRGPIVANVRTQRRPLKKVPSVDATLMGARYPDPFVLGRQVALLVASGKDAVREDEVRSFMSQYGFDENLLFPVRKGLDEMGVRVVEPSEGRFNLKNAKVQRQQFEEQQRIRINHPTAPDYQECGRIVGIQGDPRSGYWYYVLVDGSSVPKWFPQDALEPNEAGIIVDPVTRPIADE